MLSARSKAPLPVQLAVTPATHDQGPCPQQPAGLQRTRLCHLDHPPRGYDANKTRRSLLSRRRTMSRMKFAVKPASTIQTAGMNLFVVAGFFFSAHF